MLQIYNSLTNKKEPFESIETGKVKMYVCGMTVYDYCHLGHAMAVVVFDMVLRYMRWRGFEVSYARNITDLDDKIINRAQENGEDFRELTARFTDAMYEDFDALSVLRPDFEPRATDYIEQMIAMTRELIDKGYAYTAANGDVYYDVSKFAGYGKLSGKKSEDLRAGERIEINEFKDDPADFVLWKAAKPGEPSWDSPWGKGRPSWHIECSAMSVDKFGASFDIHGGGRDLQFPHHENEIAQSEACTGKHFVNYWMHNGHVRVEDEKMSKSLGNFFTVREILKHYKPEEVRFFIVSSHYRSPLNYSDVQFDNARNALTRLYTALRGLPDVQSASGNNYENRFREAMDDDFNTPEALAVLFDLARDVNRARDENLDAAAGMAAQLRNLGGVLGLLQDDPEAYLKAGIGEGLSGEEIENMIRDRKTARDNKDWAEADRLRDELQNRSIVLEDKPDGTTLWRRE